jgi:hypothetical protein
MLLRILAFVIHEAWLTERLVDAGWTLLGAGHLTLLILRFLR